MPETPGQTGSPDVESVEGRARRIRRRMRRGDFLRATGRGQRISTRYFVVFALPREAARTEDEPTDSPCMEPGPVRLGITVTRRVGNAVRRNRIKRLVREWFRCAKKELGACDLVVIAKRDLPERLAFGQVKRDLDDLLEPRRAAAVPRRGC